jgi:hypothetical protein
MLTIQFVPYTEIEGLNTSKRVQKLLKIVKEDKIVILEGKLKSMEEAELIKKTMEEITAEFKGIEIASIQRDVKNQHIFNKIKAMFVNALLGDRQGLTLIGPANLIKEIKKDPDKIQLLLQEAQGKKRR